MKHILILLCTSLVSSAYAQFFGSAADQLQPRLQKHMPAFEENKGQICDLSGGTPRPDVLFRLQSGAASLFLMKNGIACQLHRSRLPQDILKARLSGNPLPASTAKGLETYRMDMTLLGSSPDPRISVHGRSRDYSQYYRHQVTEVYSYQKIIYHDVYPFIDWVLYSTENGFKYDFIVRPGGNPADIRIRYTDHEGLELKADGSLHIRNRLGEFIEEKPYTYQGKQQIKSRFVLEGDVLRFELDAWNPGETLYIDPSVQWSSYYGGSEVELAYTSTTDASGNVYLSGSTVSLTDIATSGYQNSHAGFVDAFLVKFDAAGNRIWATYYGGGQMEEGIACATDRSGNVLLAGLSASGAGIAAGGHQNSFGGGDNDGFLVKFDAGGFRQWATYFGGSGDDVIRSCHCDANGNILIAGYSNTDSGLARNGHRLRSGSNGQYDAILASFSPGGVLRWSTYYGGPEKENGNSCYTDASGNVYLCGSTESDSAIALNGFQTSFGGWSDAFLAKFDSSGRRIWGTYLGGEGKDEGFACATDVSGNIIFSGYTAGLPVSAVYSAFQDSFGGGGNDAFVCKFDPNCVMYFGTYTGGEKADIAMACHTDDSSNIFVSGYTSSATGIAFGGSQNDFGGGVYDGFLMKIGPWGERRWSTYFGDREDDYGLGTCASGNGSVYLSGTSFSAQGIASNGHQNSFGGQADGFIGKLKDCYSPVSRLRVAACDSFIWRGQTLRSSGRYTYRGSSYTGCDSVVILELSIGFPQGYRWPSICAASFDPSSGKNIIRWESAADDRAVNYLIYRESGVNQFVLAGTVSINDPPVFTDANANPLSGAHRYRLALTDSCGHETPPDSLGIHKTIWLRAVRGIGTVHLNWNLYEGRSPGSQVILRSVNGAAFLPLDTVPEYSNEYNDSFAPNTNLTYRIELSGAGCNPPLNISSNPGMVLPVGLEHTFASLFHLYPNPAENRARLESSRPAGLIEICDLNGRVLLKKSCSDLHCELDLSRLARGMYLLCIRGEQGVFTEKLLLE